MLEDYIADSFDEAIKPYTESTDYIDQQNALDEMEEDFKSSLSEEQRKKFLVLRSAISQADGQMALNAYLIGVRNGAGIRPRTIAC